MDRAQRRVIITPVEKPLEAAGVDEKFARQVNDFIEQYRTALEELTKLAGKNYLNREIIQLLVALNRKNKPDAKTCVVSLERRGTPPAENNYGVTVADDDPP